MEILAVFKSRSEAIRFASYLDIKHIAHTILSIPMNLGLGCGLCVCFGAKFQGVALNIIDKAKLISFTGFYQNK